MTRFTYVIHVAVERQEIPPARRVTPLIGHVDAVEEADPARYGSAAVIAALEDALDEAKKAVAA